jgi:hypothetical protein
MLKTANMKATAAANRLLSTNPRRNVKGMAKTGKRWVSGVQGLRGLYERQGPLKTLVE